MSKGYYIFLLIFCFTFESYAQNSLVKTVRDTVKAGSQLIETVQAKHEKAKSSESSLRKGEMIPSSKWVTDFNGDSILSNVLLRDKFSPLEGHILTDFPQYFKGDFSIDPAPISMLDRYSADFLLGGSMPDFPWKDKDQFQKGFESQFTKELDGEMVELERVKQSKPWSNG